MDFSKIKNLIKQTGDKFIVMDNGEPELVVMSFAEYEKLNESQKRPSRQEVEPEVEEMIPAAIAESIGLPVRLEDIRLEDLPI